MISVNHLDKTYDRHSRHANGVLHDISFTLPDTGFVCIIGPSGCGKTSLLNAIGGLDTFDGGTISTDHLADYRYGRPGTEAERNQNFGYIFQNYYLLPDHSVAYNVYLGMHSLPLSHREKCSRVREALTAVDMDRYLHRNVGELSGGQQQRVAIARALARRPKVIFADEPTGNLDEANTLNICTLLHRISRDSLVVMVTHEERIARFFADRILVLADGRLKAQEEGWKREKLLAGGNAIYTGDYENTLLKEEGVQLRILREEGTAPVQLTVVVSKDRVLLQVADERTVTCGTPEELPQIIEGEHPALSLETVKEAEKDSLFTPVTEENRTQQAQNQKRGRLPFSMLWQEARHLLRSKTARQVSNWAFLVILTILTLWTVSDYLNVASIEPEDFITTDSHVLEITLERGSELGVTTLTIQDLVYDYMDYLEESGLSFSFVPTASTSATYTVQTFRQMGGLSELLTGYSYVPLSYLKESELIYGRMPENSQEIVVDRWVLESLMSQDGIIQSGISDVTYFLGRNLTYAKKNYSPTIVGISDCGEPAIFLNTTAMISIGAAGNEVITLEELKKQDPDTYGGLTLGAEECIMVTNNAGLDYQSKIGSRFTTNCKRMYQIADAIEADTYASVILSEEGAEDLLHDMITYRFYLYCEDKEAMKTYIAGALPDSLKGKIQVQQKDAYAEAWQQYRTATQIRLNGRRIVTMTVLVLSMVMLALLQRTQIRERIGMVAVYRLLGIPGYQLAIIYGLECILLSARSILPAAALTWLVVAVLTRFPSLALSLQLPWQAALLGAAAIVGFYLLVSLIPLWRLLQKPPARLAGQYDL